MDAGGAGRLNRSSPSCLNRPAQRTAFFHGLLHLWSHDHDSLQKDALKCFEAATRLVVETIGQNIQDGKILLNPKLVKYLARKGVVEAHQD